MKPKCAECQSDVEVDGDYYTCSKCHVMNPVSYLTNPDAAASAVIQDRSTFTNSEGRTQAEQQAEDAKREKENEPQWVPWTFETCPRDGWVRNNDDPQNIGKITVVSNVGIRALRLYRTFETCLECLEYSHNGIDSWQPCGTEVK